MAQSRRKEYEAGIKWWDITDREHYMGRREFMRKAGTVAAGVGLATAAPGFVQRAFAQNGAFAGLPGSKYDTDEEQNTLKQATTYNNFWEFGAGKNDPARNAKNFVTAPWEISIGGLLANPVKIDVSDVIARYRDKLEQRIYRMRCVEAWSMVIPWVGFPLHELIKDYQPDSAAKYMRFETLWDPEQMRKAARSIQYPYVEGLRMDEAMNDLTLVTVGMYGDVLQNPNGPPIKIVIPWKYGFKSIKSINKIEFVADEPVNTWKKAQPREYGFYSNVNPERPHPRWSQATERRIGERGRRETLKFNGYGEWVASMYQGMDLINRYY
ncbi:MAG: protein-methionine-sulfoxide reductase catalytic subunit MsrP [Spirochaetaceae bacterium]|nr:protein-methionine-sulfoxide reductase catalytic subunit MsrP [Spirochaetaceae bacterium]